MRRMQVCVIAAVFGALCASQSRADFAAYFTPDVAAMGVGVQGDGAGSMSVLGTPTSFDDGSILHGFNDPPTPSLSVNILGLNAAGTSWTSGILSLTSETDTGDALNLTGTLTGLQYQTGGGDLFEMLFKITGGSSYALSHYPSYVVLKLDANFGPTDYFDGSFAHAFTNDGGGDADLKKAVVPAPGASLLAALGLAAIGAFKRRISA